MKKIKNIILFIVIAPLYLLAQNSNIVNKSCTIATEEQTFPMGDTSGKYVLTQEIKKRDCNLTMTVKGKCIKWKVTREDFRIDPDSYNTYQSNSNSDSMGQLIATIGAYSQLSDLWSGWKGYCIKGTKKDFSWMSDPMFWATMAVSYGLDAATYQSQIAAAQAGGTAGSSAAQAGSSAAQAGSSAAASSTTAQIGQQVNSWSASISNGLNSALGTSLKAGFGKCLIAYGMNMAQSIKNFMANDEIGCDPVDEFCGNGEDNKAESKEKLMTMDATKFNDLLTAHPEYKKYLKIISTENNIVTFRFKRPDEISEIGYAQNQEAMKKAMQKLKNIQFAVRTAVNTAALALCAGTGGTVGGQANYDNGGKLLSVQNGLNVAVGFMPVDPATKLALRIAIQLAYSFKKVDSCDNRKDAVKEGARHERTEESLPYGLCHFVESDCADKLFKKCILHAYHYCCYDQVLSRVLIEQIKAQLGRDWVHCTGISLRDLQYVSFKQCSASDKKKGFDGAHQSGSYDPMGSYQFKARCIDYTDLINYLRATVSPDVNLNDFKDTIDDLSRQSAAGN